LRHSSTTLSGFTSNHLFNLHAISLVSHWDYPFVAHFPTTLSFLCLLNPPLSQK
jgi:hypothetical protein